MSQPLVTIGLTTYNARATLDRAIRSALNQNWRPIEIVAVDDASTDGTFEYLQRQAESHPELRVFSNPVNNGVATSRNRIIAEAKGEFVVFFDDDDESLPERISLQYLRITEYESGFAEGAPVICHTSRQLNYPNGKSRIDPTMGIREGRHAPAGLNVARRILVGSPLEDGYGACPTCSQMARLSTYRMINGFDPNFRRSEDTEFNVRLAEAGGHFVGLAKPLVIQTMTKTSEKSLVDEYRFMRQLLEKHRKLIEGDGLFEFALRWLDIKQAWLEDRRFQFARLSISLAISKPILTFGRMRLALPNIALNRAFSDFYKQRNHSELLA